MYARCGLCAGLLYLFAFTCGWGEVWSESADLDGSGAALATCSAPAADLSSKCQAGARAATAILLAHPNPIVIPRLDSEPKLSDFLSTPVRSRPARQMLRISDFVQRYPSDGAQPSNATTAYLGYTHKYFFAAFVCEEHDPKRVRAHMLARDSLGDDDSVQVMLDTFHDRRRGFSFETNPLGIQADSLFSEQDNQAGRQGGGGGPGRGRGRGPGTYDYSFDTVWSTWGTRTRRGYVVLMRIPFASLYFAKADPGQMRTWGIVLGRNISYSNEMDYWPQEKHDVAGFLTQDIAVEGFSGIARGRNLQYQPYALARNLRQLNTVDPLNPYFQHKHLQGYEGLDAKFILHNSLVLDTALNPDFSEVGINNPAAPNERFPPFFPEVRPFFIENSSYFQTPINLYYTDNIITPQYGARLTGKLGRWALGLLVVDDRSPGEAVPPGDPEFNSRAHFYVGRVNHDLGSLSNVGLIYADREYLDSYNRAGGLDYRVRLGEKWTITGQAVTTETKNISNSTQGEQSCETQALTCSGQAYYQQVDYSDLHHRFGGGYIDTSAGYVTNTGFFLRPDVREGHGIFSYIFRPAHGWVLQHSPAIRIERIWDHNGVPLDFYVNPGYRLNFKHRTFLNLHLDLGQDRLRPVDYPALSHNVEYHSHVGGLFFRTAPTPYLSIGAGFNRGTVINYEPPDGKGPGPVNMFSPSVDLEVKLFRGLDLQNNYMYSHFTNLTNGDLVYDNHQFISRWNFQMTQAASFSLIGQYLSTLPDSRYTDLTNSKSLFADALFTYMPHPGTALYVGYIGNFDNYFRSLCTRTGEGQCDPDYPILAPSYSSLINDDKNIYVKVSYLLRF